MTDQPSTPPTKPKTTRIVLAVTAAVVGGGLLVLGLYSLAARNAAGGDGSGTPTEGSSDAGAPASCSSDEAQQGVNDIILQQGDRVIDAGKQREIYYDAANRVRYCFEALATSDSVVTNWQYKLFLGPSGRTLVKAYPDVLGGYTAEIEALKRKAAGQSDAASPDSPSTPSDPDTANPTGSANENAAGGAAGASDAPAASDTQAANDAPANDEQTDDTSLKGVGDHHALHTRVIVALSGGQNLPWSDDALSGIINIGPDTREGAKLCRSYSYTVNGQLGGRGVGCRDANGNWMLRHLD